VLITYTMLGTVPLVLIGLLALTDRTCVFANVVTNRRQTLQHSPDRQFTQFQLQNFSLATAVALGCCSFEAYNAPYKSYGLKEVSICGTETIFMDRDFLSSRIQGVLEVSKSSSHQTSI